MKPLRLAVIAIAFVAVCRAEPLLPTLFGDHMVLQRGRKIHVWGKADPAEKLAVSIAGRTASVTADPDGQWSARLPELMAGGPFTLTVQGTKTVVIKDVMIGEVWIASGQSNMAFALSGAEGAEVEVPKADYDQIRLFTVLKKIALSPQSNTRPTAWQICTPDSAKSFSAVAYFFARELHKSLGIPIGIIQSSWPGTTIETWVGPDALRADAALRPILDEWDRTSPAAKSFAEQAGPLELEFDDFELIPLSASERGTPLANFDDGSSRLSMGGSFSYSWVDAPDAAFKLISPGHGGKGFAARVAGRLDGTEDSRLTATFKLDRSPVDLSSYSGIRFWVRGNGSFRYRSHQPTISDWDDYSTDVIKASSEWQSVTVLFRDLKQEGWGVSLPFTQNALSGFVLETLTLLGYPPIPPSGLYEGMITPLMPYELRGAIWYQGESNAPKAHQYRKLLPALISSWRQTSGNENLEFLIVQLPNHGATPAQPDDSAWAELREAQFQTMKNTPHTGLAVTIDVGDPKDVHPHRKLEVGERLAMWALGTTYKKPIAYSGPLYESMDRRVSEIRIRFSHVDAGLEARGAELLGFSIAGADRKFHWAKGHIDGDTVVVSSPEVANPVAVRYAWADSPECNLFGKNGLPASPFRTDDWPGITEAH